jgi:hypothetical protein
MTLRTLRRLTALVVHLAAFSMVVYIVSSTEHGVATFGLSNDWPERVSGMYQIVATFVALGVATGFVTAQLAVGGGTQRLYALTRQPLLISFAVLSPIAILLSLGLTMVDDSHLSENAAWSLVALSFVAGFWIIGTVVPIWMLQVELLHPEGVAREVVRRLTPRNVREYGLTRVDIRGGVLSASISLYSVRPRGADPLRPFHEVLMQAVHERDRVLVGRIVRVLLDRVAYVHGTTLASSADRRRFPDKLRRFMRRYVRGYVYTESDRLHVTLMVCHYLVKRSRLLVREWDGRDTARHGIVSGLCDLAAELGEDERNVRSVEVVLWSLAHVTDAFKDVDPQGPVEPLVSLFALPGRLSATAPLIGSAELAVWLLMWARENTCQLEPERLGAGLDEELMDLLTGWPNVGSRTFEMTNVEGDPWNSSEKLN